MQQPITAAELHDGHSTHYEGVARQVSSVSNKVERAVRLCHEPITYPTRVRVWTSGQLAGESQE